MKKHCLLLFVLSVFFNTYAQVKISSGTGAPDVSAGLDVDFNNKGFLPPRITTVQRNAIISPASGLIIFNTTSNCLEICVEGNWQNIYCGCSSAPTNLTYSQNGPLVYCLNQAIIPNVATVQQSNNTTFSIFPPLPEGLIFQTTTGQISGIPTVLSASDNYVVTASNACGSTTRILNLAVKMPPSAPVSISGAVKQTVGNSASYSISAVSAADSYTWSVPTGWVIQSGQGTNSIQVTVGSTSGSVSVTASNSCGISPAASLSVAVCPVWSFDFSTLPVQAILVGNSFLSNGECVLTNTNGGQNGSVIFQSLCNADVSSFKVEYDQRIWDGSGADGMAFSYGDFSNVSGSEEGLAGNNQLAVSWRTYPSPTLKILYTQGGVVSQVGPTSSFNIRSGNYRRVIIQVNASNQISVTVDGTPIWTNVQLPAAYATANKSTWRMGFSARTGGVSDKHSIDNLSVISY
jgi:hypothetical protein